MDIQSIIYKIGQFAPGLLLAVVCHEWAHGYVAKLFGDDTAERSGRLTLNPVSHIDPFGTIFFPLLLTFIGATPFGWAKPVPVVSRNFSDIKRGVFWVSFAGPLANFFLGVLSAFFYVLLAKHIPSFGIKPQLLEVLRFSLLINFILMGFNLIPLPPLDGSRMLATFLKGEALRKYEEIARYTPMIFLGFIALSYMGLINIFGILLGPFMFLAQVFVGIFNFIL